MSGPAPLLCRVSSRCWSSKCLQEQIDVYSGRAPLQAGERKHVVSAFVADEAGLIARVAGVFARRGVNIESLAVGLNVRSARFTIVLNGSAATVATLCKQLAKLVKVLAVETLTDEPLLEREMALFKVAVPTASGRRQLVELTHIFKGRVVDVGSRALTVALAGDAGKLVAFQAALGEFEVLEVARTGRVVLRRSEPPGTPDMAPFQRFEDAPRRPRRAGSSGPNSAPRQPPQGQAGADVYMIDPQQRQGVWAVQNVLEPDMHEDAPQLQACTLSILLDDRPGALNEVASIISRRGYNIQSLAVGSSEVPGVSRITTVIPGDAPAVAKLVKHIERLVNVRSVMDLTATPHVERELMLIKVWCGAGQRSQLKDVADMFKCKVSSLTRSTATVQMIGSEADMRALRSVLEPFGVLEVARSGRLALARASRVDSRLLNESSLSYSYV